MPPQKIYLRPLEEDDLEYLHRWENEPEVWQYGDCGVEETDAASHTPRFSREELRQFIENQQSGFYANEQLRLVICRRESTPDVDHRVGFIDLFDFDPVRLSAAVGILICDPADRRRGYGRQALALALEHARCDLGLKEINCTVAPGNPDSEALFAGAGFRAQSDKSIRTFSLTQ